MAGAEWNHPTRKLRPLIYPTCVSLPDCVLCLVLYQEFIHSPLSRHQVGDALLPPAGGPLVPRGRGGGGLRGLPRHAAARRRPRSRPRHVRRRHPARGGLDPTWWPLHDICKYYYLQISTHVSDVMEAEKFLGPWNETGSFMNYENAKLTRQLRSDVCQDQNIFR